jgi:hypothetical protein
MGEDLKFRSRRRPTVSSSHLLPVPFSARHLHRGGELVQTLEYEVSDDERYGQRYGGGYEVGWNMKNQAGKDIASGVYLVVARLFDGTGQKVELAEEQVKVAVIR